MTDYYPTLCSYPKSMQTTTPCSRFTTCNTDTNSPFRTSRQRLRKPLHTSPLVTHEPVGNGLNISTSSTNRVIEIVLVHGPRIVSAESLVVVVVSSIQLLQTISGRCSFSTITNHLENAALRVAGIESDTSVGLHDARVADTVVGGTDTNVAARFLHDDAKNNAGIDA